MDLATKKKEIIKWISTLENPLIIEKIDRIKDGEEFDFEKEWSRSISGGELKKRSKDFLRSLPWTK